MLNWEKIGLVCCSNAEKPDRCAVHEQLRAVLSNRGIETVCSPYLYAEDGFFAGTGRERGEAVNRLFQDSSIDAVCDLSGGDMANEVLEYLDFTAIQHSKAIFCGYSDLTTVINAIYSKTGKPSVLYQIKNLVGSCGQEQQERFFTQGLLTVPFRFLRGAHMEGTVVGGNIRCLLKLAGTEYFPDFSGKILFLEANSGRVPQLVTYLSQLKQLKVFEQVSGIILGTFSQMEREQLTPTAEELMLKAAGALPVAKTPLVGHGSDSRAMLIGGYYQLSAGDSVMQPLLERTLAGENETRVESFS